MSGLKLASDTLKVTPEAGDIEYNGEFFGTDSAGSRAQLGRLRLEVAKAATGTAVDFTNAPPWATRATVMLNGVSTNGASPPIIQLGDAGGIENTGYLGSGGYVNNAGATAVATQTTGFAINAAGATSIVYHGLATLVLFELAANTWIFNAGFGRSDANLFTFGGGSKTLSALLTQIRITTVNGTDTFDAGTINILYEG